MHKDEAWQVFGRNGEPIIGQETLEDEVNNNSNVGIAQLWVWRRKKDGTIEVLLQQRAMSKKRHPGFFGSSAGGHVNTGEGFLEAVKREAKEEIDIDINPEDAYFVAELRSVLEPECTRRIYLYEASVSWVPNFNDGEVDSVEWHDVETFKKMTTEPDRYKLVNHGDAYFSTIITALERL